MSWGFSVLRSLLEILREKEVHSPRELALKLGESEEMVTVLLDELAKRGVISSSELCAPSACDGCPVKKGCKSAGGKIYFLKK